MRRTDRRASDVGRAIETDVDLVMYLLEDAGVAVVPGSGFLGITVLSRLVCIRGDGPRAWKRCLRIAAACRRLEPGANMRAPSDRIRRFASCADAQTDPRDGRAQSAVRHPREEAGFDAIWASGFELSALYGLADVSLFRCQIIWRWCARCDFAVRSPIVADIDTGFGNAVNVIHAVASYERAGANAVVIEDKHFPEGHESTP